MRVCTQGVLQSSSLQDLRRVFLEQCCQDHYSTAQHCDSLGHYSFSRAEMQTHDYWQDIDLQTKALPRGPGPSKHPYFLMETCIEF